MSSLKVDFELALSMANEEAGKPAKKANRIDNIRTFKVSLNSLIKPHFETLNIAISEQFSDQLFLIYLLNRCLILIHMSIFVIEPSR